jgi:hypothetical protein
MYLKVKSPLFIDHLTFELNEPKKCRLKAVLIDDRGSVCSAVETDVKMGLQIFDWKGLNDLPYGVYTLEVSGGTNDMKMRLVKRV